MNITKAYQSCEAGESKQDHDGLSFDFDKFYIYYYDESQDKGGDASDIEGYPLRLITSSNYPEFDPFWLDPLKYKYYAGAEYEKYFADRCTYFKAFAALVDPFTPVHAFSSFFPVQALRLPSWTWQSVMDKMTTFLQMGPLVIPADVPPFQREYRLKPGYEFARGAHVVPGPAVPIPAIKVPEQDDVEPIHDDRDVDDNGHSDASKSVSSEPESSDSDQKDGGDGPAFLALGLSTLVDSRPRFKGGPYTVVEGFL
ncbi:hypothetical protein K505DRAFT_338492 [Melanomma pulvis-pyrius CBS 109.77]|uniref:Uncharacterized protein n=1 Tax=Melanomma pulvis-pyrius CBS 109.77 TaxID=1314802 RepID=A0A6A6X8G5_9PLEO|nr:hypothetical protein K505DRAFT_338492 [Melanomma pulvis-pyrius CBS 109.77]